MENKIFNANDTMRTISREKVFFKESQEGKALDDILSALGLPAEYPFFDIGYYGIMIGKAIEQKKHREERKNG